MKKFKIVIFLMVVLIALTAIANKRKLPYPILLLAAGLTIGFIPQLPCLALHPDVIFVIILPPLLYNAASKTSWHEFKTPINIYGKVKQLPPDDLQNAKLIISKFQRAILLKRTKKENIAIL